MAQGGASRAGLVSVSQDSRRLLRSVAHAHCAPRFGVLGLTAPNARAIAAGPPYSAGIRIQPWRMAYKTAWVRSFADSLRRMFDMWFLTVCRLIERA